MGNAGIALAVDDVYEAVEELRTKGVEIVMEPKDSEVCMAWVKDPWGNLLCIHHRHDDHGRYSEDRGGRDQAHPNCEYISCPGQGKGQDHYHSDVRRGLVGYAHRCRDQSRWDDGHSGRHGDGHQYVEWHLHGGERRHRSVHRDGLGERQGGDS
mgnify:CR=1 FL=1